MPLIDAKQKDWRLVPERLRNSIRMWVEDGRPPGRFLQCVLTNDLASACTGDSENTAALGNIVHFLRWHCPRDCWGSPENFRSWPERLRDMRAA